MVDGNAALIAFIGVLAGGYLNISWQRTIAGFVTVLAGELASHMAVFPHAAGHVEWHDCGD
ncbi:MULTISPECIES: hypothetical protein [Burkholderia]|uniref:hypothetical protein n=1 Tax=Burkholderia TaxID=32008 RepID=UPI00117E859E|nr:MULTISPECIES: hypothetical protein [Burkholderia]NIE59622.1 hypothetical protein [Burkholderia sp. Ap-955]NIF11715.1 hypothetical protein [Burkholderia sp. Ax-1735]NIG04562.1 hypothetical protein [Burkholderia sp. Tr-849]